MANVSYKNPVLKKGVHKVTSPYGMRTIFGQRKMHNGIDLVGAGSTLDYIIAFADGVVVTSKFASDAGEYVKVDHGNGNYTRYLHLKTGSRTVKVGDKVQKGQILGYMGSTGNVTGAHLHFDVNVDGAYVDPEPYLKGEKEFDEGNAVRQWQLAAIADGFKFPKYGADGKWGSECEAVAKQAICKQRQDANGKPVYKYKNLTKIVQKAVNVTVDGCFGKNTQTAVKAWQKLVGLKVDGCVGPESWKKMLGVK